MYDLTRCTSAGCPKKTKCIRQTKSRGLCDSNFKFSFTKEGCDYFLLVEPKQPKTDL